MTTKHVISAIAAYLFWGLALYAQQGQIFVDQKNQTTVEDGSSLYPYTSINGALEQAVWGDTIKVAQGLYAENVLIQSKRVFLLGSFAGGTIDEYANGLGGDFLTRDYQSYSTHIQGQNTDPVIELRYETSGTIIDGFTITGGHRGIFFDSDYTWPPVEQVLISNNIIENNGWEELNDEIGGGLLVRGDRISIKGNIIRQNKAGRGGALCAEGDSIVIQHNTIEGNIANSDHGGALYLFGKVILTDNLISNNRVGELVGYGWGGGVIFMESGTGFSVSERNIYCYNYAPTYGGGVFVDEAATVYMSHDLVYENSNSDSYYGGAGVAIDESGNNEPSYLFMNHCTVAFNHSEYGNPGNGVLADVNAMAEITNSIFYGNGGDFHTNSGSAITISFSLCEDEVNGEGVIHDDPFFADASQGDFHLRSKEGRYTPNGWVKDEVHSPAIDTGDPNSDYHLETHPNGDRVNLGRYGNTAEASRSMLINLHEKSGLETSCTVWPNPALEQSELVFSAARPFSYLRVFQLNGRQIMEIAHKDRIKKRLTQHNLLTKGVYTVVFYQGDEIIGSTRLIVVD
ncbi:MAG: hypothetical protein PHC55_00320 [Bacteroidales bacterium]|nr:hypothetical protein [Bacteroidales bacterium]